MRKVIQREKRERPDVVIKALAQRSAKQATAKIPQLKAKPSGKKRK